MANTRLVEYIVAPGDCVASIAARFGQTVGAIWSHAENAALCSLRADPFVLAPGDRVLVAELESRERALAAGQRHVFQRRSTHTEFEVKVLLNGRPRGDLEFCIHVDGGTEPAARGVSDADGVVRARLPALARRGVIEFADRRGRVAFTLGELDPIDTVAGIQGRLRDLGYYFMAIDGDFGSYTARALRSFQTQHGLTVDGEINDETKRAIVLAYGR